MALVVWAAVLEARRPRAGTPVLVLLALAGLLRPEAWLLSGLYWLWLAWRASWRARIGYAALVAVAPLLWFARRLRGHRRPAVLAPLHELVGGGAGPPADAGGDPRRGARVLRPARQAARRPGRRAGVVIAARLAPRRMAVPLMLLVSGVVTFALIGVAGLSVIERYLLVASLAVLLFAAVAAGGFTLLPPGARGRRAWAADLRRAGAGRRAVDGDAPRPRAARRRAALPRRRAHRARAPCSPSRRCARGCGADG